MDPLVFILLLIRVLGCLGHLALALSYAGVLDRWINRAVFVVGNLALALAEALDKLTTAP